MGISLGTFGAEIDHLKTSRRFSPHVALWAECAAPIGTRHLGVPEDQAPSLECIPLLSGQHTQIVLTVGGDHQVAIRLENYNQFVHPPDPQWLREMGRHREGIDEVKCLVSIVQGTAWLVCAELGEEQIPLAPIDQNGAIVCAKQGHMLQGAPLTNNATTTTSRVQHRA